MVNKYIYIIGLTEKKIDDFDNLLNVIELGLKNRTIGITKVNQNSSSSHGIIQINIFIIKIIKKWKNNIYERVKEIKCKFDNKNNNICNQSEKSFKFQFR